MMHVYIYTTPNMGSEDCCFWVREEGREHGAGFRREQEGSGCHFFFLDWFFSIAMLLASLRFWESDFDTGQFNKKKKKNKKKNT